MAEDQVDKRRPRKQFGAQMDFLLLLGVLVGWIVLQAWILPRFGVST